VLDESTPETTQWQCILYGDLYELAPSIPGRINPLPAPPSANGEISTIRDYIPPRDYEFRQLNDSGSEVTVDIHDVAGRLYPDLLDPSTQTWFTALERPAKFGADEYTAPPGESVYALMGLLPGNIVGSRSIQWKDDLYSIVIDAQKLVEGAMKKYYETILRQERGDQPTSPSNGTSKEPSGNGAPLTSPRPSTLAEVLGPDPNLTEPGQRRLNDNEAL